MSERKGTISVDTQDIFPIIKKWLYSEHDIFLRELIANATDAITKRATMARTQNQEIPTGKIQVLVNKDNKTIKVIDNGIGMTDEEVEKYIAKLAFSGAEEFIQKMKKAGEDVNDVIGKFGLGFYSSFMVSNKVQIDSLSMSSGAKATRWTCEGNTDYTFNDSDRSEVGTTITLFINEESEEFLNDFKVTETLRQYCDFMPYEISVLDELRKPEKPRKDDGTIDESAQAVAPKPYIVNDATPLWKRDPKDIKDEEYKEFYRKLFPMDGEPLFWIHLKVDHPFTLEGILFFPKINPLKPFHEKNIRLYCKQVFVSDNVKSIVPEFLSLLKGTIDSTDIPLNVSRSSLQGDPNIKRISNYIIKKVAESLKLLYKNDRKRYEQIWPDIHLFVKYGCVSDTKFDELMRDKVLFETTENNFLTFQEYKDSVPAQYKEKMKDLVLYFEKGKSDISLKKQLQEEKIHVINTDEYIDPHFMQHVETHKVGDQVVRFSSVDSEINNILESENTTEDDIKIKELFQKVLVGEKKEKEEKKDENPLAQMMGGDGLKEVDIAKIKNSSTAAYFKTDESMKRFSQMTKAMGQNSKFPLKKVLMINPNNPLIQNALKIHQKGGNEALVEGICRHVEDLAQISSEGLNDNDKDLFIQRTQKLMQDLTNLAL